MSGSLTALRQIVVVVPYGCQLERESMTGLIPTSRASGFTLSSGKKIRIDIKKDFTCSILLFLARKSVGTYNTRVMRFG